MSRLSFSVLIVWPLGTLGWLTAAGQQPAGDVSGTSPAPVVAPTNEQTAIVSSERDAERAIEQALGKRVSFKFKDEALRDVLAELARAGGFPLWIDEKALVDEGVLLEGEAVSAGFEDVTIEQVLNRLLPPLDVTWIIGDEVLRVTTWVAADESLTTRIYDVRRVVDFARRQRSRDESGIAFGRRALRDQAALAASPKHVSSTGWLLDLIHTYTSGAWEAEDGTGGTATLVRDALVVRQTYRVHREVQGLLDVVGLAIDGQLAHGSREIRPTNYSAAEEQKIRAALGRKTRVDFRDMPLKSCAEDLARQMGVTLIIDEKALQDEGIQADEPVTIHLEGITWRSALHLMLEPLGLTPVVEDGYLKITTQVAASEVFVTVLHDIRDLAAAGWSGVALEEAIISNTSGPWGEVDGTGGDLASEPLPGMLLVRQTEQVHHEVASLLADLRQHAQAAEPAVDAPQPEAGDPARVATRFYPIDPLLAEAPQGSVAEQPATEGTRPTRTRLEQTILELVAPETWKDHGTGGQGVLKKVNELLVVRQSLRVHLKLREFLDRLELAAEAAQQARMQGFQGGFGEGGLGAGGGGGFFSVPLGTLKNPD